MNISRYTDYSLRVLMYLALSPKQLVTIADIATSYDISKNHLMKIVQELNIKGYVCTTRGKNGGLQLNQSAGEINLGKLVRELETQNKLLECFGDNNTCIITPHCQLKQIFAQALESFYQTLEDYCLADLLGTENRLALQNLLAIKVNIVE